MRPDQKTRLNVDRLKQLMKYNPETGSFTRNISVKGRKAGVSAGNIDIQTGYLAIGIDKRRHYGHRLAWLYMTGEYPTGEIDHINGVRGDNRFINLRDVHRAVNKENLRHATSASSSQLLGAYKKRNKWESKIQVNKSIVRIGVFDTPEKAHEAYVLAKRIHHKGCTL